jgi:hypothetical protein
LAGLRQLFAHEHIQKAAFAHIGAANKSKFGPIGLRSYLQAGGRLKKNCPIGKGAWVVGHEAE